MNKLPNEPKNEKPMHAGHRQRVRQRYLSEGLENFEEHQVVELLLFYGIPRRDTNELAHRLLARYGSFANMVEAGADDLKKVKGISENTAVLISMIPQLARFYHKSKWKERPILKNALQAGEYIVDLFTGAKYESFYCVCLDAKNRVRHTLLLYEGTIDETRIYPRNLVEEVLRCQAHQVILAHNHPGGDPKPSRADMQTTVSICESLAAVSIQVLDHIIVGGKGYFSFAMQNLLPQTRNYHSAKDVAE